MKSMEISKTAEKLSVRKETWPDLMSLLQTIGPKWFRISASKWCSVRVFKSEFSVENQA